MTMCQPVHLGIDLCDGGRSLLDLRFADDILIFGTDYHVIGALLDKLVENLAAVGLQLNTQKTKVLTTQAQPPSQLQTPNGLIISVLDRESTYKWLGCMLTTAPAQTTTCDVECRLQAAANAFNANWWILCDPNVSIAQELDCSGTRIIAKHRVAIKHRKNSYFNFRGATAIFLAYRQWR